MLKSDLRMLQDFVGIQLVRRGRDETIREQCLARLGKYLHVLVTYAGAGLSATVVNAGILLSAELTQSLPECENVC